jgi:hypothetical protein
MANKFTPFLNGMNVLSIQQQIAHKNGFEPHHVTIEHAGSIITDYDSFPYNRWFRGVARASNPIVAEREAGWRPRNDNCYKPIQTDEKYTPTTESYIGANECFQGSCSVNKKCNNNYTNENCIIKYR